MSQGIKISKVVFQLTQRAAWWQDTQIIHALAVAEICGLELDDVMQWVTAGKVRAVRVKCESSEQVPNGEIMCVYLDDLLACIEDILIARPWDDGRLDVLVQMLSSKYSIDEIAAKLKASVAAVLKQIEIQDFDIPALAGLYTCEQLAELLELSGPGTVRAWIRMGLGSQEHDALPGVPLVDLNAVPRFLRKRTAIKIKSTAWQTLNRMTGKLKPHKLTKGAA